MDMEFLNGDISRVVLAALLGAVLGMEREWKGKAAGFRTLMLVSVGSALFTEVSYHMANLNGISDATRIASNIVTGIGFIGAGLIFKRESSVHGLTTAATIWLAAALGMAAGSGNYGLAIATTIIAWLILVILQYIELGMQKLRKTTRYVLVFETDDIYSLPAHESFFTGSYVVTGNKLQKKDGRLTMELIVRTRQKNHEAAVRMMIQHKDISCVDY